MTELRDTPESAYCACGHLVVVHTLTGGKRRACTHMDDKGQCPCRSPR